MRRHSKQQLSLVQATKTRRLGRVRKAKPDQVAVRRSELLGLLCRDDRPLALRDVVRLARGCSRYRTRVVSDFRNAVRGDLVSLREAGRVRHQLADAHCQATWVAVKERP